MGATARARWRDRRRGPWASERDERENSGDNCRMELQKNRTDAAAAATTAVDGRRRRYVYSALDALMRPVSLKSLHGVVVGVQKVVVVVVEKVVVVVAQGAALRSRGVAGHILWSYFLTHRACILAV